MWRASCSACSCHRAGRWSWRRSTVPPPSGRPRSTSPCASRSWATTASGSTTTSTTCPNPLTKRCSNAGPRWLPSASARHASGWVRWWAATATANPVCWPRSPPPSMSSAVVGSIGASAPAGTRTSTRGTASSSAGRATASECCARRCRSCAAWFDGEYYKLSREQCDPKLLQ